jgi:hypothetical protein
LKHGLTHPQYKRNPCDMKILLLLLLVATAAALPIPQRIYSQHVNASSSQNSPAQAVALAKSYYDAQTDVTPELCDHYVGVWYGHSASGWPSAIDQWKGAAEVQQSRCVCRVTRALRRNSRRQEAGRLDIWCAGVLRRRHLRSRGYLRR